MAKKEEKKEEILTTPAEKARPAPVRIMTFTLKSSDSLRNVLANVTSMSRVRAFRASGLLRVMVATPLLALSTKISFPVTSVMLSYSSPFAAGKTSISTILVSLSEVDCTHCLNPRKLQLNCASH